MSAHNHELRVGIEESTEQVKKILIHGISDDLATQDMDRNPITLVIR